MTSLQSKSRPPCGVPDQSRPLRGWDPVRVGGAGKLMGRRRKKKGQGGDLREAAPLEKADALGSLDSPPYPLGTPFLGIPSLPSLPLPLVRGEILGMGAAILPSPGPQRGLGAAGPSNRGRWSVRVLPGLWGPEQKWAWRGPWCLVCVCVSGRPCGRRHQIAISGHLCEGVRGEWDKGRNFSFASQYACLVL